MTGFVDINGKISSEEEASLPLFDRAFLLGDGCFEVVCVSEGHFLCLESHLNRLYASLQYFDFKGLPSRESLQKRLIKLLDLSGYKEAYVRITFSGGVALGFSPREELKVQSYLFIRPWQKKALGAARLKLCQTDYTDRSRRHKTNSYGESLRCLEQARKEGFSDILWQNSEGELTEASTANLFFIEKQGRALRVLTPCLSSGLLAGVTRSTWIAFFKAIGVEIREEVILADRIASFQGAFLSSAMKPLTPVLNIDSKSLELFKNSSFFESWEKSFHSFRLKAL